MHTHTQTSCVTTGQGHKGLSTAGPGLGAGDGPGTLPPASSMTPSVGWGASRLLRMGLGKNKQGADDGGTGQRAAAQQLERRCSCSVPLGGLGAPTRCSGPAEQGRRTPCPSTSQEPLLATGAPPQEVLGPKSRQGPSFPSFPSCWGREGSEAPGEDLRSPSSHTV